MNQSSNITTTIVTRAPDACPTTWCGLATGHDRPGHQSTVATMDTPEGKIRVELETPEEGGAPLINVVIPGRGLDDLAAELARTLGAFLGMSLKVAAHNLEQAAR